MWRGLLRPLLDEASSRPRLACLSDRLFLIPYLDNSGPFDYHLGTVQAHRDEGLVAQNRLTILHFSTQTC